MALALVAGAAGAVSRPVVVSTYYQDVRISHLLAAYKHAYVKAGFRFRSQTTVATDANTKHLIRLKFRFDDSPPGRLGGVASFVILAPRRADRCTPCSLHQETLGVVGPHDDRDFQRYTALLNRLLAADRQAKADIRGELGTSPPPFDEASPSRNPEAP